MTGWTAVDLDGTLAYYEGWNGGLIGPPIPRMVDRVKAWLAEGKDVRIFTARLSGPVDQADEQRALIEQWCATHLGQVLPVTNVKDWSMIDLWDDRCVEVVPNLGVTRAESQANYTETLLSLSKKLTERDTEIAELKGRIANALL